MNGVGWWPGYREKQLAALALDALRLGFGSAHFVGQTSLDRRHRRDQLHAHQRGRMHGRVGGGLGVGRHPHVETRIGGVAQRALDHRMRCHAGHHQPFGAARAQRLVERRPVERVDAAVLDDGFARAG